jgi:DtxR family Mn-dependent transcriptional regulator
VRRFTVRRLTETIQTELDVMTALRRAGVTPGASIRAHRAAEGIMLGSAGEYVEVSKDMATHILVDADA